MAAENEKEPQSPGGPLADCHSPNPPRHRLLPRNLVRTHRIWTGGGKELSLGTSEAPVTWPSVSVIVPSYNQGALHRADAAEHPEAGLPRPAPGDRLRRRIHG